MVTKKAKKPGKKIGALSSRNLTAKQAKGVKGGGFDASLPAVQKVQKVMGDGSVRPVAVNFLKQ